MDMVSMETGGSVGTLPLKTESLASSRLFISDLIMVIEVKNGKEETILFPQQAFNQRARIVDNLHQMIFLMSPQKIKIFL